METILKENAMYNYKKIALALIVTASAFPKQTLTIQPIAAINGPILAKGHEYKINYEYWLNDNCAIQTSVDIGRITDCDAFDVDSKYCKYDFNNLEIGAKRNWKFLYAMPKIYLGSIDYKSLNENGTQKNISGINWGAAGYLGVQFDWHHVTISTDFGAGYGKIGKFIDGNMALGINF